ncbi:hypothetical protein CR513_27320, partial [Mucuna pruriens]
MKPFWESYKHFKDHFFQVAARRYSVKDIAALKARSSCSTTLAVGGVVAEASPLATLDRTRRVLHLL